MPATSHAFLKNRYLFAHLLLAYFLYTGHLRTLEQQDWHQNKMDTPSPTEAIIPTDPWQQWVTYWPTLQMDAIHYHTITYQPPRLTLKGQALDGKTLLQLSKQLKHHNLNCQSHMEQQPATTFTLTCQTSLTP